MPISLRKLLILTLAFGLLLGCDEDFFDFEDEEPTIIIDDENEEEEEEPEEYTGIDGDPCTEDQDCRGGTCIDYEGWPDGYCTTMHCDDRTDCADGGDQNACLIRSEGANFCIRLCDPTAHGECRDGYRCRGFTQSDDGFCEPAPTDTGGGGGGGNTSNPNDIDFEIECVNVSGQQAQIEYQISSGTDSYMIVPFTQNGYALSPQNIYTPSGQIIDFRGQNYFQAAGAQMFGIVNPTIVPAVPQFGNQLESGLHTYTIETNDSEVCYYLLESPGSPTTIDLNIYMVGVPGINADNAADDPDMQAMLNQTENIFSQAGIALGNIEFHSVSSTAEQNYRVIHDREDISNLISHSEDPESFGDNTAISANVFITAQFAMGGALGISQGIPGAAGIHAHALSGVAMTGEYIGEDFQGGINGNDYSAVIMAHELGHYLGLFHTSEQSGTSHDPLNDTPECTDFSDPFNCPDWGNLMFPSAYSGNTKVTSDQSHVLRVNPLTQ